MHCVCYTTWANYAPTPIALVRPNIEKKTQYWEAHFYIESLVVNWVDVCRALLPVWVCVPEKNLPKFALGIFHALLTFEWKLTQTECVLCTHVCSYIYVLLVFFSWYCCVPLLRLIPLPLIHIENAVLQFIHSFIVYTVAMVLCLFQPSITVCRTKYPLLPKYMVNHLPL